MASGADVASAVEMLSGGHENIWGKRFLGRGVQAYFGSGNLSFSEISGEWQPVLVTGPGKWSCGSVTVEVTQTPPPENPASERCIILNAAKAGFPFMLRPWKEGDWMCPLGMGGRRRKLSDIFVSLKIPAPEKGRVVLMEYPDGDEGRIAAVIGRGKIDDSLKISVDTQFVIRLYEAGSEN